MGGVEQGQADGHIAVIGHGSQQEALSCPKCDHRTELSNTTSNMDRSSFPEEAQTSDLGDKDFKTTVLKKTKELKEYVKSRNGVPTK